MPFHLYKLSCFLSAQELETAYSPSRWSPRLDKDAVIEAYMKVVTEGMGYPRVKIMGWADRLPSYRPPSSCGLPKYTMSYESASAKQATGMLLWTQDYIAIISYIVAGVFLFVNSEIIHQIRMNLQTQESWLFTRQRNTINKAKKAENIPDGNKLPKALLKSSAFSFSQKVENIEINWWVWHF